MAISDSESQIPYHVEQVLRRWFSKNLKTAFEFNCDSFNGTLWSLWSLWSVQFVVCGFAVGSALTHVPDHGPSAPDRKTQA